MGGEKPFALILIAILIIAPFVMFSTINNIEEETSCEINTTRHKNVNIVYGKITTKNIQGILTRQKFVELSKDNNKPRSPADILVVDDGYDEDYLTDALDEWGIDYDLYTVPSGESGPNISVLQQYDIVLWHITGWSDTLFESDVNNLTEYLDQGGKLFISGQDLGYDIHGETWGGDFMLDYLRANYWGDNAGDDCVVGQADTVFSGLEVEITSSWPDYFELVGSTDPNLIAKVGFKYETAGYNAATVVYNKTHGWKVIYFAFGSFNRISDLTMRVRLIGRILRFFGYDNMIKIISPSNNSVTYDDNITLTWEYINETIVDHFELYRNSTAIDTSISPSTLSYNVNLPEDNKVYNITLVMKNASGIMAKTTIFVKRLSNYVEITSPANGTILTNSTITVEWNAVNYTLNIDHFEIYRDGTLINDSIPNNVTSYDVDLPTGDKWYNITLVMVLNDSSTRKDMIWVCRDVTPPNITVLYPENETTYAMKFGVINLRLNFSDNIAMDHINVSVDNGPEQDIGLATEILVGGLCNGTHNITVKAYDKAGNVNETFVEFTILLPSYPKVLIVNDYSGSSYYGEFWNDTLDFLCIPYDYYDVGGYYNDGPDYNALKNYPIVIWTTGTAPGSTLTSNDVDNLKQYLGDGGRLWLIGRDILYDINDTAYGFNFAIKYLRAFYLGDDAGNETLIGVPGKLFDGILFHIDDWYPDYFKLWPSTDPKLEVYVGLVYGNDRNACTVVWNKTHDWKIIYFGFRYEFISEFDVHLEIVERVILNFLEKVVITSPEDWSGTNTGSIEISWQTLANYSNVVNYTIFVNGSEYTTITDGLNGSCTITFTSEGIYNISVRANLEDGRYIDSNVIYVVYDATNPSLEIISPANGTKFNTSNVTVQWSASDNCKLKYINISLNNMFIDQLDPSITEYTFIGLPDGKHNVTIVAVDYAGNVNSTVVIFFVDTTPPCIEITQPLNGTYVLSSDVLVKWTGKDSVTYIDYYVIIYDNGTPVVLDNTTTSMLLAGLSEGYHNVTVIAYDAVGNSNVSFVWFYVDTTPPSIEILSPENDSLQPQTFLLEWNSSDSVGLDRVEFYINGTLNQTFSPSINQYLLQDLEPKVYNLTLVAYDKAGHVNSTWIIVTVIVYRIEQPAYGVYINKNWVNVSWYIETGVEIDHFEIYKNTTAVNTSVDASTRWYNVTDLAEGDWIINVTVVFVNGKSSSATVLVHIDLTPPGVSVVMPINNTYTNNQTVEIRWNVTDNYGYDHTEIIIDGVPEASTSATEYVKNLAEGDHEIKLVVYDYAGNVKNVTIIIHIDLTSPTISIDSPVEDTYFNTTNINVSWSASDNYGIDAFYIYVNGSYYGNIPGNVYNTTVTLGGEGYWEIEIVASDYAGNNKSAVVHVYVDTTPPTVSISNPTAGSYVGDPFYLEWDATDNFGFAKFVIIVDYVTGTYTKEVSGTVNRIKISLATSYQGSMNITVIAYDMVGYRNNDTITVIRDIQSPSISIVSPPDNSIIPSDTFNLTWSYDDNYGVSKFLVYVNDSLYTTTTENMTSVTITEGTYVIAVYAVDYAGNNKSDSIIVAIDIEPPNIDIISPSSGEHIANTTVTFTIIAMDNISLYVIDVIVDGSKVDTIDVSGWKKIVFDYNLTLLEGVHTVEFVAWDMVGRGYTESVVIYIDITPPSITITSPVNGSSFAIDNIIVTWNASDEVVLGYFVVSTVPYRIAYYVVIVKYLWDYTKLIYYTNDTQIMLMGLLEGPIEIIVNTTDRAGNINYDSIIIIVDYTKPSLSLVSPSNGEAFRVSSIDVSWSASDNIGLDYIVLILYDSYHNEISRVVLEPNTTSYTLIDLDEGKYIVRLEAYDEAGNYMYTEALFYIDTTPPEFIWYNISAPNNGSSEAVDVIVEWYAKDNISGIERFEISLDNKVSDTTDVQYYVFKNVSAGSHIVKIIAYDYAGNKKEITIEFTIATPPKPVIPITYLYIAAMVVMIGVICYAVYRGFIAKRGVASEELIEEVPESTSE